MEVQVSASVRRIAFPNPRLRFVFVIRLLLDAVTMFVSWSLFVFVADTLCVFTTVTVGVLLLMSSMVTFVFGDLWKCDTDILNINTSGWKWGECYPMPEKVLFWGLCWVAIQARPAPSPDKNNFHICISIKTTKSTMCVSPKSAGRKGMRKETGFNLSSKRFAKYISKCLTSLWNLDLSPVFKLKGKFTIQNNIGLSQILY